MEVFGTLPDGRPVYEHTLRNASGASVRVISYGGIIVSLVVPDVTGLLGDVVLGYETLEEYLTDPFYLGAIIGRYGNRIRGGRLTIDGISYQLVRNDRSNHLHGGAEGFHKKLWRMETRSTDRGEEVLLERTSPDGEQGYPGNVNVRVSYLLTDLDELEVRYLATSDRKTVINLTQHSYFNLSGDAREDISDHEVMILADGYTPVNDVLIPTGQVEPVGGTPFDLRTPVSLRQPLEASHPQLVLGHGIDHNFVLAKQRTSEPVLAARLHHPLSGRVLEVLTDEPGIQLYTGNFLDGARIGKNAIPLAHRTGLCLETQHFPDSPNQPAFPSTLLREADTYRSTTVFRFSAASQ